MWVSVVLSGEQIHDREAIVAEAVQDMELL